MVENKRQKPRANISFPITINISGRSIPTNLVSLSHHVVRIEKPIETSLSGKCTVLIPIKPQLVLECTPIITEKEEQAGGWIRLHIETKFNLDNTIRLINTSKRARAF